MNKKLISLMIATSFASLFTVSALSAPVANLKISGDIKPPTCTVNGGDNDLLYALGNYSPSLIPNTSTYQLSTINNQLIVSCDAETYLTFKGEDAYAEIDTIIPSTENINVKSSAFNLVNAGNTAQQVGGITFNWENVTVDGAGAYMSRANDGPNASGWNIDNSLLKDVTIGWTKTQQRNVSPAELTLTSGKIFTANIFNRSDLNLSYILPNETLTAIGVDISEGVDFIGQAVLTFNFGI